MAHPGGVDQRCFYPLSFYNLKATFLTNLHPAITKFSIIVPHISSCLLFLVSLPKFEVVTRLLLTTCDDKSLRGVVDLPSRQAEWQATDRLNSLNIERLAPSSQKPRSIGVSNNVELHAFYPFTTRLYDRPQAPFLQFMLSQRAMHHTRY